MGRKAIKIFVVDDDKSIRQTLQEVLEDEDFEVESFATGRVMLKALAKGRPALVLLDVWIGKEDGIEILDKIKETYPTLPVVMISGHGTIEQAVAATKKGAVDFLEKPLSLDTVLLRISEVLKLNREKRNGKAPVNVELEFDDIIGVSEQILTVKQAIAQAASTNARVFIYGENGTGKELVARAIFRNSKRHEAPFVEVNCAAIPEELIESELFGHEKGSFTGATEQRIGKFEQAHSGPLFLDEICDMSLATQARMLRALQEQRFARVGGTDQIEVDVRIIVATNIRPEEAISEGRFREDLYYRLNVYPIHVPPLRERKSDLPALAQHFLQLMALRSARPVPALQPEALAELQDYDWPGNIRELRNICERLLIRARGGEVITAADVQQCGLRPARKSTGYIDIPEDGIQLDDVEKQLVIEALRKTNWNQTEAAKLLGISTDRINNRVKKYQLTHSSWRVNKG